MIFLAKTTVKFLLLLTLYSFVIENCIYKLAMRTLMIAKGLPEWCFSTLTIWKA